MQSIQVSDVVDRHASGGPIPMAGVLAGYPNGSILSAGCCALKGLGLGALDHISKWKNKSCSSNTDLRFNRKLAILGASISNNSSNGAGIEKEWKVVGTDCVNNRRVKSMPEAL